MRRQVPPKSGVPASVCMSLLGHRTAGMFRRYSIVDNQDLKVGVAQLAAFYALRSALRDNHGTILPFAEVEGGGTNGSRSDFLGAGGGT